ncbi:hypothetical protein Tco_0010261 [Tanacetum coccineum]
MHKEDQQATGGPTSLGVTSEERAYPQLSSANSTAEADSGLSAPNDSIPQQHGLDEGTKNTSFDHISTGTDPHVLADQTQYVSEGLEIVLTQPTTRKRASSIARQVEEEESSRTIKLEDLAKLVSALPTELKDLHSKFNELTEEVKGLKIQVHNLEFELPDDLKEMAHGGGLKVNQRHKETINLASYRASAHMEFCSGGDGSWNGFGYNKLY